MNSASFRLTKTTRPVVHQGVLRMPFSVERIQPQVVLLSRRCYSWKSCKSLLSSFITSFRHELRDESLVCSISIFSAAENEILHNEHEAPVSALCNSTSTEITCIDNIKIEIIIITVLQ